MIKNWGVIGGIAAAVAAGVYVLWGPITVKKKRKKGENLYISCMQQSGYVCGARHGLVFLCRHVSGSAESGKHLLFERFAPRPGSVSVLRQVAGEIFRFA